MTINQNRDSSDRKLARRVIVILAVTCAATLVMAASSRAEHHEMAPERSTLLSKSARTGAGATNAFYSVPGGKAFHMTQACVEHTAMTIEVEGPGGTFSVGTRGCHSFHPAYVVDGSATFRCKNRSGQMRSCSITGRMAGDTAAGAMVSELTSPWARRHA